MTTRRLYRMLISYFVRGILYTVPFAIIAYIIYQLFVFFDSINPTPYPGLGLLILLAFITLMGWLGNTIVAQPIAKYAHRLLDRVPLLKTIYTAVTDLLSAFVGPKKRFNNPVLVKMTKNSDLEKLGFVTSEDLSSIGIGSEKIAVYLPHSYNFSGNLYIVPRENVVPINQHKGDIMKFIVSGGVTDFES